MRKLSVIGSTGSIGRQALQVVRNNPGKLSVRPLAACTNIDILEEQIREFAPKTVCVFNEDKAKELSYRVGTFLSVSFREWKA